MRIRTTDTLSWHPDLLSVKSSCSLTRLSGSVDIISRAVTAVSTADITNQNNADFSALANKLANLTDTLQAKVAAAAAHQRVSNDRPHRSRGRHTAATYRPTST